MTHKWEWNRNEYLKEQRRKRKLRQMRKKTRKLNLIKSENGEWKGYLTLNEQLSRLGFSPYGSYLESDLWAATIRVCSRHSIELQQIERNSGGIIKISIWERGSLSSLHSAEPTSNSSLACQTKKSKKWSTLPLGSLFQ